MEEMNMEIEKLVEEAVADARRIWESDMAVRLAEARAEGERLAGMSAEEKLSERERKLAEREKEMMAKELRARMELRLVEEGLPRELAKAFDYGDEAKADASYAAVTGVFREAVQAKVAERLGVIELPKAGAAKESGSMTDEQYYAAKMNI